jgi:hypothetical protein
LSYPALYTHKRNKHNIIPITGKPEIFKLGSSTNLNRFKYNFSGSETDVKAISTKLIEEYIKLCNRNYLNQESMIFEPKWSYERDSFLCLLKYFNSSNIEKIKIPNLTDKETTIDNILAIYSILIIEVTRGKYFIDIVVQFVFLFREYLNLFGWDHFRYLNQYGLYDNIIIEGEFCTKCNCEEIPNLVNDFICHFLELDENFTTNKREIIDITQNFCNWLYIYGLTNYKLSKNDCNT